MAVTVFGEDDDLSDLLSEGSAITEVERELRGETVRGGEGRQEQHHGKEAVRAASQQPRRLMPLTSLTSSPLHLHPSSEDSDASDSEADSTLPQSSPGYIPTALEHRSDT